LEEILLAFLAGNREPLLLKACAALALDLDRRAEASECSRAALDTGADSTWHYLRLGYIAARDGLPPYIVRQYLESAIVAARTPEDIARVGWHLDYRAPGFWEDAQAALGERRGHITVFREKAAWMESSAAERLAMFARRFSFLGDWGRVGSGDAYAYAHFHAILHSAGDFRTCAFPANPSFPGQTDARCRPPFEVAIPSTVAPHLHSRPVRLWHPNTMVPVAVIPYAIETTAWGQTGADTVVRLSVRMEGKSPAATRFAAVMLRPPSGTRANRGEFLTGYVTIAQGPEEPVLFRLEVRRDEAVVTSGLAGSEPRDGAGIQVSDLVIGTGQLALRWPDPGENRPLFHPFPTVPRENRTIELYMQALNPFEAVRGRIQLQLRRVDKDGNQDRLINSFGWEQELEQGLTEIQRQLDVRTLGSGSYQVEMLISPGAAIHDSIQRRATFVIP
jgi:hypothetical protein